MLFIKNSLWTIMLFSSFLSFCMDYEDGKAFVLITIAAPDDKLRDQLRKTCIWAHQRLSINGSHIHELIGHPLFHTRKNNTALIALNAAWNNRTDALKALLKKADLCIFPYYFTDMHWSILGIVKARMSSAQPEEKAVW